MSGSKINYKRRILILSVLFIVIFLSFFPVAIEKDIDFGEIYTNSSVEASTYIFNLGFRTIKVERVTKSCSCLSINMINRLRPFRWTKVSATAMHSDHSGPISGDIAISTNSFFCQTLGIKLKGYRSLPFEILPTKVNFGSLEKGLPSDWVAVVLKSELEDDVTEFELIDRSNLYDIRRGKKGETGFEVRLKSARSGENLGELMVSAKIGETYFDRKLVSVGYGISAVKPDVSYMVFDRKNNESKNVNILGVGEGVKIKDFHISPDEHSNRFRVLVLDDSKVKIELNPNVDTKGLSALFINMSDGDSGPLRILLSIQ